MSPRPLSEIPSEVCRRVDAIFTDIDDTLTTGGRLPARAYAALWQAHDAGLQVIPVTGRPAGWCDHFARMWPVTAVVGENGALAFAMRGGRMQRLYAQRRPDAPALLDAIRTQVLAEVPGCRVAADQAYREYDLAIDFCEDVAPLDDAAVDRIRAIFLEHGANARISSIHVNGWFGDFDKLTMCKRCCAELLAAPLAPERALFVGDSPNDVPMFRFFPHSVGVANVRDMAHRMDSMPAYITTRRGGEGFAELIDELLAKRDRSLAQ